MIYNKKMIDSIETIKQQRRPAMARTRRNIPLDEKIEKAQNAVLQAKEKYDAAVEELNLLLKKKREIQTKEIQKALEASEKSFEEIMEFLVGKQDTDEE